MTTQLERVAWERDEALEVLEQLWTAIDRYGPGTLRDLPQLFQAMNSARALLDRARGQSAKPQVPLPGPPRPPRDFSDRRLLEEIYLMLAREMQEVPSFDQEVRNSSEEVPNAD